MTHFEDRLRQEARDLRIGPDTATWNRLNQRLERQRRGARVRRLRQFALAACVALIVVATVGVGRWFFTPSDAAFQMLPTASLEAVDFEQQDRMVRQVQTSVRSRARTVRIDEGDIDRRFVVRERE